MTKYIYILLASLPYFVFAAQAPATPLDATGLLNRISEFVINPIIYVLFTVAFVVFIWGLAQFVMNLDNEESRSTGVQHMIWGVIGMVIMVGVNGIVAIIDSTIRGIGG